MIYDYSLSKIVIFSHKHLVLVDGTTQSVKQRLYSLRNYYRHDPIMYEFLSSCQITLIVNFPCHDRFELNQRIKFFQEIITSDKKDEKGVEFIKLKKDVEFIKLKKAHNDRIGFGKRISFDEPVSNVLYLN